MFDRQGKRKEDFAFKLNEVKLPALEQVSDFYASQKFVQFYKKEREVYLTSNWEDGNPAEQDTLKIELKSSLDVVRNESEDQGGSGIGSVRMATRGVTKPSRTKWNSPRIQSDMFIISTRSSWIRLHLLFYFYGYE